VRAASLYELYTPVRCGLFMKEIYILLLTACNEIKGNNSEVKRIINFGFRTEFNYITMRMEVT